LDGGLIYASMCTQISCDMSFGNKCKMKRMVTLLGSPRFMLIYEGTPMEQYFKNYTRAAKSKAPCFNIYTKKSFTFPEDIWYVFNRMIISSSPVTDDAMNLVFPIHIQSMQVGLFKEKGEFIFLYEDEFSRTMTHNEYDVCPRIIGFPQSFLSIYCLGAGLRNAPSYYFIAATTNPAVYTIQSSYSHIRAIASPIVMDSLPTKNTFEKINKHITASESLMTATKKPMAWKVRRLIS